MQPTNANDPLRTTDPIPGRLRQGPDDTVGQTLPPGYAGAAVYVPSQGVHPMGTKPEPGLPAVSSQHTEPKGTAPATNLPTIPGYRVLREIARGGMGKVFAARDLGLDRDVAIKTLLPGANADRFIRESKITARLPHPGIPPVHALGTLADGSPFLAMKLIAGQNLAHELMTADRPRLLQAFTQVCQAVGFAHSRGVIHRDLKPANVMVGAFGEVQVMDWGLAKHLTSREVMDLPRTSASRKAPTIGADAYQTAEHRAVGEAIGESTDDQTQAGAVLGTPAYMAPEQARAEAVDARADVFALGGILCAILTGKPPFGGKSALEVIQHAGAADLTETHTRLDGCGADAELVALCRHCLSPNPEDRPANGQAVADGLTTYLNGVQERLQAAERERAATEAKATEQKKRRRAQRLLAAVVVIFVLAATVVGIGFHRDRTARAIEVEQRAERREKLETDLDNQFAELTGQRARLHQELSTPLGVSSFMSDIGSWKTRIEKLRAVWEKAESAWKAGNDLLDPAWKAKLDAQDEAVKADEQGWRLATEIDEVRAKLYDPAEGKYQYDLAARKYAEVFQALNMDVLTGDNEDVAARISQSPLRQVLVAALDHWAQVVPEGTGLARRLLDIARRADPDPWRDQVRDEVFGKNLTKLEKLAKDFQPGSATPQLLTMLAKKLNDSGNLEGSALLRKALLAQPKDFWLYFSLASLVKDPAARAGYYQAALALRPRSASAHNNIGITYYERKDFDEAIVHFKEALALENNKYATAETNWGLALYQKKDFDGAMARYQNVIDHDPAHPLAYNNMGLVYRDQKNLPKAIEYLNRAIGLDAKLTNPHLNLGLIFQDQKKLDAAIAQFQVAIEKAPKSANGHIYLGAVLREKKDLHGAIAEFNKAIAKDANSGLAYQNLGMIFQEQRDWGNAVIKYQKALALDPNLARSHGGLAAALFFTGETGAAIVHYKKALEIDPGLAKTYATLGTPLFASKSGDVGGKTPLKPKPLEAESAIKCYQYGVEHAEKRDWQAAVNAYHQALVLDPDFALAHCSLGLSLQQQGKFAEALKSLQKGHELGSRNNLWDQPSADWVSKCARLLELQQKLPALLKGQARAKDAAEKIELAYLCGHYFNLHGPSVRYYAEAFAETPSLASNYENHYNAACYAAIGGTGQSKDYETLTEMEKAQLRQQALAWLRDELLRFKQSLQLDSTRNGNVQFNMKHWQNDPDFAGVRDDKALAQLPAAERKAWQQFWNDMQALVDQAQAAAKKR